jgi:hypothetical protein
MANISSELLAEEDHCKQLSGVLDNYRSAQDIFRRVHRHYNQIYFNSDPSAVTNHSIGMFDLFQWYQQKV